jgi:hypothetical protein
MRIAMGLILLAIAILIMALPAMPYPGRAFLMVLFACAALLGDAKTRS